MKMKRLPLAIAALGALLAAGSADAKHNFSVDSVNQPVVSADRAVVPNCPNWKTGGLDSAAVTDSNYGCAINSNLAAMMADPMDLIHGKTSDVTDTFNNNRAIKAWREAEPTSKLWSTTTKVDLKNAAGG
jgi:pilus assembly protein CpaD